MDLVSVVETGEMNAAAVTESDSTPSFIRLSAVGDTYEKRVDYAPDHAKNPLSEAEPESKMRGMAEPLLTEDAIETTVDFCAELSDRPTVERLVDALEV